MDVVNLFAFRATEPADMAKAADPVGPENNDHILATVPGALIVCAWGVSVAKSKRPVLRERAWVVRRLLNDHGYATHYLKSAAGGVPCHPLYLKGDLVPLSLDTVAV